MTNPVQDTQIHRLLSIALKAGDAIMKVYRNGFSVDLKDDRSPLTEADRASHNIIVRDLGEAFPDVPVLSEEGEHLPYAGRAAWKRFFLVDPLDGTKEFIKRLDEFTVNIAYLENGVLQAGVVYAPATGELYWGRRGAGAYASSPDSILENILKNAKPVTPDPDPGSGPLRVVASRSHMNAESEEFIARLRERYGEIDLIQSGSSLKITAVASGRAHIYPRLAPTMEWDTAAAQAVLEAAGGGVYRYPEMTPLMYHQENLRNPPFVAAAGPELLP
jgi:3'(2'), 5'-bisphosphate nucleotidase